ncbi:hypothetical protein [Embleya hyalina]|uniref:Uncharacterized protein n=1 Tax=Embleya hyalina TaxID=516124 RepID=A0A401YYT0_9ACTN|nr:hypothetical protein [Embleya hyalina]GCD99655.1 hypothetical protein EHYA_07377 [Embleya hyalina]
MDDFSNVLSDLTDGDPFLNVASIKNAVIARLEASDADVRVESTEYFNHTYAPDLVLHWKNDNSFRHIYLRTSDNPDYIREDLAVVSETSPIIMPLVSLREHDDGSLELESTNARTLVATPSTITEFATTHGERTIAGLLSHAVLQGGRGLLSEQRARSVSAVIDAGFTAAQVSETEETRRAVMAAEALLDPARAAVLTRLLHAVWLGSGAPASTFPGATGITAHLDSAGLRLLLDISISDDTEFWRRIGKGISLEQLCELEVSSESNSLQYLVESNLDHLRAKSCRVSQIGNAEVAAHSVRWFVSSGVLAFKSRDYVSLFSPGPVSSTAFYEDGESSPLRLGLLMDRAQAADVDVDEVTIESDNGRRIDYRSPTGTRMWADEVLGQLSSVLGRHSVVISATTPLAGGTRHLKCDLENLTASGRTGAKFYLLEMLRYAIPLLRGLSPTERDSLARIIPAQQRGADG